jgi:ubiquinone/menaquinone biosynthesis C-methylase UbiE
MIICDSRMELLQLVPRGAMCMEIGVFHGDFARQILRIVQPSGLVLVDSYEGEVFSCDEHGGNPESSNGDDLYRLVRDMFRAHPVSLHRGRSSAVLPTFPDWSFDFIYIDADHSEFGCRHDLEHAWRLVRPGGWIAGHDYGVNPDRCVDPSHYAFFGVKAAVDKFLEEKLVPLRAIARDGYTSFAFRRP